MGLIMPTAITSKTKKKILVLLLITDYTDESIVKKTAKKTLASRLCMHIPVRRKTVDRQA